MTTAPIESVFARAWQLLQRNWIIIVPGIIIGIIIGVLKVLLTPHIYYNADGTMALGSVGGMMGSGLLLGLIGMVGYLITQGLATAMAAAAWQRGTCTLDDATSNINKLLPTAGALLVLIVVATFLALPTLGLAFLAYYLFTLYAFPAAIIGNAPGFTSVTESFRLTIARFVPTLIIAVLIFVIGLCAVFISAALHFVPFLGPIVGAVISQIVVAYAMLVVVGEYLALRAEAPQSAYAGGAPYPPGPSAYPPGPSASTPGPTPYQPGSATYTPPPPPPDPYTPPPPGP